MNILLLALNTKFIHTNPAIYSLRAYALHEAETMGRRNYFAKHIQLAEYTINHTEDAVLRGIFEVRPDVLCISCYLWNIREVRKLAKDYREIAPEVRIWLGGPEVSFDAPDCLEQMPWIDGIIVGEGERTFYELASYYFGKDEGQGTGTDDGSCVADGGIERDGSRDTPAGIPGLVYRDMSGNIIANEPRMPLDFSDLPFLYDGVDMDSLKHKILYYETSRGCPFSCCYCLSSVDKTLRFRAWESVRRELQFFLDKGVEQVKFVDRTFNCNREHAMRIWNYLREHDNGVTNFHFEIAADLLDDEEMDLLATLRPGFVQFEIGVQSTNPRTIEAIHRRMDLDRVAGSVARVRAANNIHQHLDLIAGLPYEDYASFGRSFDDVYRMKPNQLQLGFLKVLKGSAMERMVPEFEVRYKSEPPYEVLSTKALSYRDVLRLKDIEEMVERYYNSGQYGVAVPYLAAHFERPFLFFETLAHFYRVNGYLDVKQSRMEQFELLYRFAEEVQQKPEMLRKGFLMECFEECLLFDLYSREKPKRQPAFAHRTELKKDELRMMFAGFGVAKESAGRCYVADFHYDFNRAGEGETVRKNALYLFDYSQYDVMTGMCRVLWQDGEEKESDE